MQALDRVGAICSILALPLAILALLFTPPILNWLAKRSVKKALHRIDELKLQRATVLRLKNSDRDRSIYFQQRIAAILAALSWAALMVFGRAEVKDVIWDRLEGIMAFISLFAAVVLSLETCLMLRRVDKVEAYEAETDRTVNELKMRVTSRQG